MQQHFINMKRKWESKGYNLSLDVPKDGGERKKDACVGYPTILDDQLSDKIIRPSNSDDPKMDSKVEIFQLSLWKREDNIYTLSESYRSEHPNNNPKISHGKYQAVLKDLWVSEKTVMEHR